MENFDAIIIGTGQAGPSLAAKFASEGLKTAIADLPDNILNLARFHVRPDRFDQSRIMRRRWRLTTNPKIQVMINFVQQGLEKF